MTRDSHDRQVPSRNRCLLPLTRNPRDWPRVSRQRQGPGEILVRLRATGIGFSKALARPFVASRGAEWNAGRHEPGSVCVEQLAGDGHASRHERDLWRPVNAIAMITSLASRAGSGVASLDSAVGAYGN